MASAAGWLRQLEPGAFGALLAVPLVLALVLLAAALWSRRRARALRGAAPVAVNSLGEGFHLAHGQATGPLLSSPLCGRPCVWWELTVWERVHCTPNTRDDNDGQAWELRLRDHSRRLIQCTQGLGSCAVEPPAADFGASIVASEQRHWQGMQYPPERRDPPARPDGTPTPDGRAPGEADWPDASHRFRYAERIIAPGSELYVLGQVERVRAQGLPPDGGPVPAPAASDRPAGQRADAGLSPLGLLTALARGGAQALIDAPAAAPGFAAFSGDDGQHRARELQAAQWLIKPQPGRTYVVSVQPLDAWARQMRSGARGGWALFALALALAAFMLWARLGRA